MAKPDNLANAHPCHQVPFQPDSTNGGTFDTTTIPSQLIHNSGRGLILDILLWMPKSCRRDPDNPPKFGLLFNLLFAFAGTFTVANLYYSYPILDDIASYFGISHEQASLVPTCSQAGYATGIIFICPLGDLVRRRHLILLLTLITATLWIGLCVTNSFGLFLALSYLTSVTTVTPQILLPLVGDLAPPARRATALSVVSSGLVLGLLFARILSGLIATFSKWRNIYWLSLGLQYLIFALLWIWMPDYPRVNSDISYLKILRTVFSYPFSSPILAQATLMGFCLFATFTSFWTTLTFLLLGEPYNFTTVQIGLVALAGITPMILGPLFSHFVIDKFVAQLSVMISLVIMLIGISIGAYTGTFTIAGPIIQASFQDFGLQTAQITNRRAIYDVAPKARNRVNTTYMIGVFCGQLAGTAIGNRVYAGSGWTLAGTVNLALVGVSIILCLLRGPKETGWIGWTGGISVRRSEQ